MTFKPAIWQPIAIGLSIINLVGVGLAAGDAEGLHAGVHSALALAFGLWAQRLQRRRSGGTEDLARLDAVEALQALEGEVSRINQELSEAQERLDFVERVLAQRPESRRLGPED